MPNYAARDFRKCKSCSEVIFSLESFVLVRFIICKFVYTGIKQQMEPLTAQEEMSIDSDNHNDTVQEEKALGDNEFKDNSGEELEAGRISEDTDDGNPTSVGVFVDDSHETHIQHDLDDGKASDDAVVASEVISESPETTFVMSSYESEEDSLIAGKPEPTTEPEQKNYNDDEVAAASVISPNSTYEFDNEVRVSSLEGRGHSEISLESPPIEPSNLNTAVNPQSEALLEPMITQEVYVETQSSFSTTNVDPSEMLEIPSDGDKSSFEVHKSNRDEVPGTASVSTTAYDHLRNDFKDINASRSSINPTDLGDVFTSAGIPAPSTISPALQAPPGRVLVPASFDQVQGQALSALQALKVLDNYFIEFNPIAQVTSC